MARYKVTINQVNDAVRKANRDISAGILGIDRKNYRIRTTSQFQTPSDPLDVVIFDDGVNRVYLRDVAESAAGHHKEDVAVLHNGIEVITIGVRREKGANVLEMSERLQQEVNRLNETILAENDLYIHWVYDQRPYINKAIRLVKQNILIGGILAMCVLLLFLRSVTATVTTVLAIPISAIGTFIFLWLMGRNLNVVSLAGISLPSACWSTMPSWCWKT
jgi:hydrophobic/amphiphilic exporter-1 (mainly G- bacteria), HAE1 family